jgi:hypothetical protein
MSKFTDIFGKPGMDQDCLATCEKPNACLIDGCAKKRADALAATITGTCEVCDATNVQVSPVMFCGLETFACEECKDMPERLEMDRDFHRAVTYDRMFANIIKTITGEQ